MSDEYGFNGRPIQLGGVTLKVDDDFVVATLLAIVGVLSIHVHGFDDEVSATASRIYDEIRKQNTENT